MGDLGAETAACMCDLGVAAPTAVHYQIVLALSRVAMARLRQRADATGISEAQLATDLLEMIARDDLYDAVLDRA